jgi:uncharacterized protein YjbI with pentapeptide repeats
MKIYCENDNEIDVPYNSLDGAILEDLDLHRAKLENLNLTNTSFFKSNLRGAFYSTLV